jgi:hypothetical protein
MVLQVDDFDVEVAAFAGDFGDPLRGKINRELLKRELSG